MEIKEAIIQGIEKKAGSDDVKKNYRNELSELNTYMIDLGKGLLDIYGRLNNNYGCFDSDEEAYRFPVYLRRYKNEEDDLVTFSHSASNLIAANMGTSLPSTGGYVCFIRYSNQQRDWLLIVMLKLKANTGIDTKTLELNESLAFDVHHLHEAARIDLEKWSNSEEPYLSFIKRSGRQDQVTKYFRNALGCTDYTDSKSNTDQAIKAVDAYCSQNDWKPKQRQEARKKAYDYFEQKRHNDEPANLIALSSLIDDQSPDSFLEFVKANNYEVNETFEPHKKTYDKFRRISGKFGNVSVGFDVQDVIDGRVDYDPDHKKLIIEDPPKKIVDSIEKAKGNDAS